MEIRKVTAIIRSDMLGRVEGRLQDMLVKGLCVSCVKGYGEYANFFAHDWMVMHARIEIFTEKARAEEVAEAIMEAAHTGGQGDGIVAILPVERVFRIRTKSDARPGEI
jgi:nitrogen regulatory protein P-II 1